MDYEYIKNHYRPVAVDFSRQNELDVDLKAIQQIEFILQLKIDDGENVDGAQSVFVIIILEKIKEMRLKFSQGSITVLQKMAS